MKMKNANSVNNALLCTAALQKASFTNFASQSAAPTESYTQASKDAMQFNKFDMDAFRHSYLYHPLQPFGLPVHLRHHPYSMMTSTRAVCTCECYCMGNPRVRMPSMDRDPTPGLDRLSEQDPKLLEASDGDIFSADKSGRRNRTTYKRWQIDELERAFAMNPYPTSIFKKTLAMRLGLRDSRVQVWFQNRRAKSKREKKSPAESLDHEMLDNEDFCSVEHTLLYNKVPSQEIHAEETEITKSSH